MDEHLWFVTEKRLETVAKALQRNRMNAVIVKTAAEVPALVAGMIPAGSTVTSGGSMSLAESGVRELLRGGNYNYLDRSAPGADKLAVERAAFSADFYLASANAITENGEIWEIDGHCNRVAALAFGPRRVILVVGRNKVVADLDAARQRNRRTAAPANTHRLSCATPCAATGECNDCRGESRICNAELVLHHQQDKDRVTVILVGEELGY